MKRFIYLLLFFLVAPTLLAEELKYPDRPWWDQSDCGITGGFLFEIEKGVVYDQYFRMEYRLWDHQEIEKIGCAYYVYVENPEQAEISLADDLPLPDGSIVGLWYDEDVKVPATIEFNGKTYTVVTVENSPAYEARSIEFPSTLRYIKSNNYSRPLPIGGEPVLCSAEFIFNEGLETIMDHVFYGTEIKSLSFPSSLRYIGSETVVDCRLLEEVKFNEGLSSIGAYSFSECPLLKEVDLPQSLMSLGRNTFNSCEGLEKIHISRWIRNLNGFEGICNECPNIREIIYDSNTPYPARNSFNKVNKEECILYVPYKRAYRYAMTEGWQDFKNIVEMEESPDAITPSGVNQIDVEPESTDDGYYTTEGLRYEEWNLIPSATIVFHKGHKILKR